ncbi:hypothetical protein [Actinomadura sp. DC4]|uniref:hypothetical protein n=1 Tax=Actinomadura sp. DC4 TaxID=3055069 RepID=UPI0025B267A7|nr:hypothetical protein [Actinomadura sp. DC4]MDN3354779.1 hypothetical protein [Actinomadura sp. DC4]
MTHVRAARVEDLSAMAAIEGAAAQLFRDVGLGALADRPPPPVAVPAGYRSAGRAWVAGRDEPVAFLVADVVDRCAYVAQVSVDPGTHAGASAGRSSTTSRSGPPHRGWTL